MHYILIVGARTNKFCFLYSHWSPYIRVYTVMSLCGIKIETTESSLLSFRNKRIVHEGRQNNFQDTSFKDVF
jgi:hypothetical protein